jgi:phosphotransferase system  glucose/maltose/N-acetylglucosamine-specific IIC component
LDRASKALTEAVTGSVASALALLFSGTLAAAVARAAAGTAAIALAIALVHVALAGAFVAAAAAFLAATAGVGSLGEGESAGEEQAGDKGDDSFCFHVVNFYWFQLLVSRTE